MPGRPFLDIHTVRSRPLAWREISREAALGAYSIHPVAVVHSLNGFEVADWLDDGNPFLSAAGPYTYGNLRYFAFVGGGAGLPAGGASRRGGTGPRQAASEAEEEDFAHEALIEEEDQEEEAPEPARAPKPVQAALVLGTAQGDSAAPGEPEPPEAPEPPPAAEAAPKKTFFALHVVDEAGRPVDGVALALEAAGRTFPLEVRSGRAGVEGVEGGPGLLTVRNPAEARRSLTASRSPGPVAGTAGKPLSVRAGAEPAVVRPGAEETVTLVIPPREVAAIEVVDGMFRLDSAVVLPEAEVPSADAHESLSAASLFAVALEFAAANPTRRLLVAGHSDTSGTERHNQVLSEDRAACVLACLEGGSGGRAAFGELCDARHRISDYKQILSWAAKRFGFPCEPGKVDEVEFTGIEPIKAFQRAYNAARADLGVPDAEELRVDGSMGPKTWRAVFDCYEAALAGEVSDKDKPADRLADLAALRASLVFQPDGTKAAGFGEHHPIDSVGRDGFRSQQNRRVELLFFHEGEEPDPALPPKASDIYAPGIFRRTPLGEATPGTLSFVVTDEQGLPVPGATVEAAGAGVTRTALSDALGTGRFEGLPRGVYVVKSRKADLWLDRVVVKVAPGSEARPVETRAKGPEA